MKVNTGVLFMIIKFIILLTSLLKDLYHTCNKFFLQLQYQRKHLVLHHLATPVQWYTFLILFLFLQLSQSLLWVQDHLHFYSILIWCLLIQSVFSSNFCIGPLQMEMVRWMHERLRTNSKLTTGNHQYILYYGNIYIYIYIPFEIFLIFSASRKLFESFHVNLGTL